MNTLKSTLSSFLFLLISFTSFAQKHTISGFVKDASTGENLVGANVFELAHLQGTTSNIYGFYSITLPIDSFTLAVSYVGYQPFKKKLFLKEDLKLNIELSPVVELKAVEITGEMTERIHETSRMSEIEIPIAQIKSMPALLGEVDVMKALQLLPGVHSGGEGSSGLYIRGGGPDQNLILLDGVPVYNASHLFGFFSVFNADAIKSVDLIKGGFPARYGGRLSSVIDISMKEGNQKKIHGEGSVGIVASRFTIEGPIQKDKTSFIFSARRTYIDLLAKPLIYAATKGVATGGYYFYDLNGKINTILSERDRVYLSMYMGNDKFYFKNSESFFQNGINYKNEQNFGLKWGNITSALRWNHVLNKQLFSNTTLTYSRYNFNVGVEQSIQGLTTEAFKLNYISGINDVSIKEDFDYLPNPNHFIRYGGNLIYHTFRPGALVQKYTISGSDPLNTTIGQANINAYEYYMYAEDDFKISRRLKANLGLHYSAFDVDKAFYPSLQPRLSVRFLATPMWAVKASYASMAQYIHLLSNTGIGLPTDLWVPSTQKIKPELSRQVAAGVARTLHHDQYELSIEGYYKTMDRILEFKEGASFLDVGPSTGSGSSQWDDKVEEGKGWSYGTEVFLQKKNGKTTGWIGYSLSWTNRQFANLNFGQAYPYKYDRRHDIAIVVSHKFSEKIDVSANWVYGTGNAVTLALTRYEGATNLPPQPGNFNTSTDVEYYGSKNGFRMQASHRLDVGINFRKKVKWGERSWNIGLYNAYNRQNPFFMYVGTDDQKSKYIKGSTGSGNRVLKQVSLFPVIPFVSWSFKF